MKEQRIHQIFEVSILLKGAHALIECIGGTARALINTNAIAILADRLTQDELIEDPHDLVATHLLAWVQTLSVGTKIFSIRSFLMPDSHSSRPSASTISKLTPSTPGAPLFARRRAGRSESPAPPSP